MYLRSFAIEIFKRQHELPVSTNAYTLSLLFILAFFKYELRYSELLPIWLTVKLLSVECRKNMSFFAEAQKCDLIVLAEELGEKVTASHKMVDLRKMIVASKEFDEDTAKGLLKKIISEREEKRRYEIEERKRQEKLQDEERKRQDEERKRQDEEKERQEEIQERIRQEEIQEQKMSQKLRNLSERWTCYVLYDKCMLHDKYE